MTENEWFTLFIDRARWMNLEVELLSKYDITCTHVKKNNQISSLHKIPYIRHHWGFISNEKMAAISRLIDKALELGRDVDKRAVVGEILSFLFDEKEPGYRTGMIKAFKYIEETLGLKFTSIEYDMLHSFCISAIADMPQGYGSGEQNYGFIPEIEVTEEGKSEWESSHLIYQPGKSSEPRENYLSRIELDRMTQRPRVTQDQGPELMAEKIDLLFAKYYSDLEVCVTADEKLRSISILCRALAILHPFGDGNQRTVSFALLNKLLLENGFSPAILENPYMFDGYFSVEQMVEKIKEGLVFYKARYIE